jgi:hypothetical protein
MGSEPTSPLFVRLPTASAEKLSRAAFELKTPKRELVADLVDRYLGAEEMPLGRAASELRGPDVLTVASSGGIGGSPARPCSTGSRCPSASAAPRALRARASPYS